jgi:hypothetical protein
MGAGLGARPNLPMLAGPRVRQNNELRPRCPLASTPRRGPPTPLALEGCRLDPDWEAHKGIIDYVYCRECGAGVKSVLQPPRVKKNGLTGERYGLKFPGARRWTFAYAASRNGADAQQLMKEPSLVKVLVNLSADPLILPCRVAA